MSNLATHDLDWLIERFEANSHIVENDRCTNDEEYSEMEEERARAREIIDRLRALLAGSPSAT